MEKIPNKRICAFLIDILVVYFITTLLDRMFSEWLLKVTPYLQYAIETAYYLLRDSLFGGRSIGKRVVGLRVVNLEGNKCGFWKLVYRNILFVSPLVVITGIIEFFALVFSKEGRRLGDRLAKTRVIDTRLRVKDIWFLFVSLVLVLWFFFAEPLYRFTGTEREAKTVVASIEEYKAKHGEYPKELRQLGKRFWNKFLYTRYESTKGKSEFWLSGVAPPHPMKISYSSGRKEWRVHRKAMAWTPEEFGYLPNIEKAVPYYKRGMEYQKKGRLDEAIAEYRKVMNIMPDSVDCLFRLGSALKEKGSIDEALKAYEGVVKIEPKIPEAHLYMYMILFKQERFDKALEAYRTYIKLMPPEGEKQLRGSNELIQLMEERIRLAAKAKEPAAPKEVETAVEQKKEAPPEKAPAAAAAKEGPTRPEVGKFYVIYLKNHRQLTGKVMSKDARGLWLAIDRGAQVYVANFDIKETREQHEGK